MTRTPTGDSGERQPAIDLPPELTSLPAPRTTFAHIPAQQPTPTPATTLCVPHVPPPPPPPTWWNVVSRRLSKTLADNPRTFCIALVYLGLHIAHGIWMYYYIDVSLNPNPQRFINSTRSRWRAYSYFMYLFGALYSIINLYLLGALGLSALRFQVCSDLKAMSILSAIVLPPICAFFIISPAFGPLLFTKPAQRVRYNHRCDSWAAQVVLDARDRRVPLSVPHTALFVTAGDSRPLFSFDLDQPSTSWARFHLRKFESPEETIEPQYIPAVREIVYDFVHLRVNGWCGIEATPCLSGNFEMDLPTMDLKFNLTLGTPEVNSRARSGGKPWTWTGRHPELIYKTLNDDGSLGDTVLQTVVTRANDCTRLKTCLAGSKAEGSGGVFGPDVLAPLGILLVMQGKYAGWCSNT